MYTMKNSVFFKNHNDFSDCMLLSKKQKQKQKKNKVC